MKEMTIEQKAKAYDEAKARMSKAYNSNRCTIGFMNEIFPDIEEREDERIRKAIGYAIGQSTHSDGTLINGVYSEEALAWLKKQGEQKTVDEIAKEVCKNKESAVAFLKSTGIMNEKGELADEYKIEQDEQNPVWSEEDEDYYDAIISKLEVTQDDALLTDNQMKFLKSLKDRVQPKQEWSEEDEAKRNALIGLIEEIKNQPLKRLEDWDWYISWLKSLKDRYTWKPSNEQMEGIECTIKTLRYQLNAGDNRLDSLYNDLKKLREK